MSWIVDMRSASTTRLGTLGPGRLVLVVGPSGAGKDTLIRGTQLACAGDLSVVFPRRVVTRPSSASEDHDTSDLETFNRAVANGAFAFWWDAYGHRYGVPSSIDDDIRSGRTVVCNVSRTVIELARRRYAKVIAVLIDAPPSVLKLRLEQRDRTSDGDICRRVARSDHVGMNLQPDFTIRNVGRVEVGIRRLLGIIQDPGFFVVY
jgi:ribose 1,5-bisphosphokinase